MNRESSNNEEKQAIEEPAGAWFVKDRHGAYVEDCEAKSVAESAAARCDACHPWYAPHVVAYLVEAAPPEEPVTVAVTDWAGWVSTWPGVPFAPKAGGPHACLSKSSGNFWPASTARRDYPPESEHSYRFRVGSCRLIDAKPPAGEEGGGEA